MKIASTFLVALFCLSASMLYAIDIPYLNNQSVNDNAHLLSQNEVVSIEQVLKNYEVKTSNQIAVLTVTDLQGQTIETFANEVFRSWKLGQKGKDNGVLIVISVGQKNTARIEVGYGLEAVLPDATAWSIINNDMKPAFKAKQYGACITAAVTAIEKAIGGEYKPKVSSSVVANSSFSNYDAFKLNLIEIGIALLVAFIIAAGASLIHRVVGGFVLGVSSFYILHFFAIGMGLTILFAIIAFAIGLVSKEILAGAVSVVSSDDNDSSSGWGNSRSSDGGGFSGSGGSSGGGGASGSLD